AGDRRATVASQSHLVLDTKFFDNEFKQSLLSGLNFLDETTGGVLIDSENFQALNLLRDRYHEQITCAYLDPPYNTGDDGFPYKDNYQHSSWLAMMEDRLQLGRTLLIDVGVLFISIG